MNELQETVHLQGHSLQNCVNTVSALLISSFFFELIISSEFDSGFYCCQSIIHCCLKDDVMIWSLMNLHSSCLKFVTDTETLMPFSEKVDVCCLYYQYSKRVKFYIRHSSDLMTIYLQIDVQKRWKISEFSQTMQWFVKQQNLDEVFETSDHSNLSGLSCQCCSSDQTAVQMVKRSLSSCLSGQTAVQTVKRRLTSREKTEDSTLKKQRH